uniref:Collagen alpha-1(IX) chain-like n=1 Tax=Geotrypetes seraphini TaxID=260995 RepID=A0A6P8QQ10_GEOSA|nr:collagen alpha-1(IX) chain-like [Geotrypetes seraphini]
MRFVSRVGERKQLLQTICAVLNPAFVVLLFVEGIPRQNFPQAWNVQRKYDYHETTYPEVFEHGSTPYYGYQSGDNYLITLTSNPYATENPEGYYPVEPTSSGYYPGTKLIPEEAFPYPVPTESYIEAQDVTTVIPKVLNEASPNLDEDLFPVPEISHHSEVIDLLKELRISSTSEVNVISGSKSDLTAYELGPRVQILRETRFVTPYGLPEEFSLVSTFRMGRETLEKSWNLLEVKDRNGTEQFRLRLYGEMNAVEVYNEAASGDEKITTFENVEKLFDGAWHKLSLSARRNQLALYVDCQLAGTAPSSLDGSIKTDGVSILAKNAKDNSTSRVDMQQLEFSADPFWAAEEACCELPDLCGNLGLLENLIDCNCSPGDPGFAGFDDAKGFQGAKGKQGSQGQPGLQGYPGIPGDTGVQGNKGEEGPSGIPGIDGQSGEDGPLGVPGIEGQIGLMGPKGDKGDRGPRGPAGRAGSMGSKGGMGDSGLPGNQGSRGLAGPKGSQGNTGDDGLKGDTGWKGNVGKVGAKGDEGDAGDKGSQGACGSAGSSGPKGRRGIPGLPGSRGFPGPRGEVGNAGPPGLKGLHGPEGSGMPDELIYELCHKVVTEQMTLYAAGIRQKCASACPTANGTLIGPPGPCGAPGVEGEKGKPGLAGMQGQPGPRGPVGVPGPKGGIGEKGDRGQKGEKGGKGVGLPGPDGYQGPRGFPGHAVVTKDGLPGPQGPPGYSGPMGRPGMPGPAGVRGYCEAGDCSIHAASLRVNRDS